jgi:hypothetical protein
MGNSKARAIYECNLSENYRRSQTDSAMEQFIRSKYEQQKWIQKDWKPRPIVVSPDVMKFLSFNNIKIIIILEYKLCNFWVLGLWWTLLFLPMHI